MSLAGETVAPQKPKTRILCDFLRLLLGFALLSALALPCIFAISEWGSWSDWLDMVEEIRNFFGNWASAWLLIGFMAFLPLLGAYTIAEAFISLVSRSRRKLE